LQYTFIPCVVRVLICSRRSEKKTFVPDIAAITVGADSEKSSKVTEAAIYEHNSVLSAMNSNINHFQSCYRRFNLFCSKCELKENYQKTKITRKDI